MSTTPKAHGLLPRTLLPTMASAANHAIDTVLAAGLPGMISPPRSEVGFVAAVTLGGIQEIAKAWKPLCRGLGLAIDLSGVFCHAAPMVKFMDSKRWPRRCELADLLVVVDVGNSKSFVRRAALVQAKMARAAARVSLSSDSSRVQLDLYQNWQKFDFEEAVYGMSLVDFTKGGRTFDSGTFGVIDRHFKTPVWTQHTASPTPAIVWNQPYLGEFIAEMVDGARPGFGRLATPTLKTDWSKTVDRLLAVTYGRAFHHKPTLGPTGAPRGVHAIACLSFKATPGPINALWSGSVQGPPYRFETREDGGQPSGISVVHIGVSPIQEG
jgi:hypothetical protein